MATVTTNNAHYAAIAAAIRTKNGETARYTPSAMAGKIADIPTGAKLTYSVIAAQTRPGTAEENTIWIKSSRAVTKTLFQREEPASPTAGTVWIKQGITAHAPFRPVEDADFLLYPVSAKQYTGSAWTNVPDVATYINGAWENWHTHLYDRGNEYTDFTGGWNAIARAMDSNCYAVTPTLTREAQSLYVTATSFANSYYRASGISLVAADFIDLTNVSTIGVETSDSAGSATLGLRASGESYINSNTMVSCSNGSSTKNSFTLDVSSISGLREVSIVVTSGGSTSSANPMALRVHRVWLE